MSNLEILSPQDDINPNEEITPRNKNSKKRKRTSSASSANGPVDVSMEAESSLEKSKKRKKKPLGLFETLDAEFGHVTPTKSDQRLEPNNHGSSSRDSSSKKSRGKKKQKDKKPHLLEDDFEDADFRETWRELVTKSNESKSKITPEIAEVIRNMHIVPMHKVHFSRKFETTLLRPVTDDVKHKIKNSGLTMKTGKFNLEEDEIIKANWEDFSVTYGIKDPTPFLKFSLSPLPIAERKNFVLCLARGLPYRYLQAIYKRFSYLYSGIDEVGKFTAEEDRIITLYQKHNKKNPFATLSKVLNRSNEAIYRRSVHLESSTDQVSGKVECTQQKIDWNRDTIKKVITTILNVMNLDTVKELRDKHIPPEVWCEVGKECDIKRRAIKHFWDQRLYTQLFSRKPIFVDKMCLKVLDLLHESNINYWQDVKWNELAQEFHGVSGVFLWNRFRQLVRSHVPEHRWEVLRDSVEYLNTQWRPEVILKTTDTEFQRLIFKNGELYERPLKSDVN